VRKPKSYAFHPVKVAARKLGARCFACPLLKEGIPVPAAPVISGRRLRLIAVGEGPGAREEQEGRPFIGKSGQLFDSLLSKNKLLRSETHVTNGALCLDGATRVRMANGATMRLNQIVKTKHRGRVLSIGENGHVVSREIVGWHRNLRAGRKMVSVTYEYARKNLNGANRTQLTGDHRILTPDGWRPAGSADGCLIATGDRAPIGMSLDIAMGTLLGDGSVSAAGRGRLTFNHAWDQRGYAKLKALALEMKTSKSPPGKNSVQWQVKARSYPSGFFRKLRAKFYPKGRKRLPEDVMKNASDLLIAIWYMDDGYLRDRRYTPPDGRGRGIHAEICAAGLPRKDVLFAVKCFREKGFDCRITKPHQPNRIMFSSAGARELSRRIARFVPSDLQYKLLQEDRGQFDAAVFEPHVGSFYAKAIVRPAKAEASKMRLVYCIDVKETHNFLTTGVVAHNCRAETDVDKKRAAHCCTPRLLAEIAQLPSTVPIVTMGAFSTKAILGMGNITLIRGFIWRVPTIDEKEQEKAKRDPLKHPVKTTRRIETQLKTDIFLGRAALAGRVVLPTLHPAHILRQEVWGPVLKIDFKRVGRVVRGEVDIDKLADKGKYTVTTDVMKLTRLGRTISLDVETDTVASPLLATLLCVGMSDGITTIVLWPWNKRMAKPLSRFLATRETVVCHNLSFDRAVLWKHKVM
jgi:uracil-DNA glycosylase